MIRPIPTQREHQSRKPYLRAAGMTLALAILPACSSDGVDLGHGDGGADGGSPGAGKGPGSVGNTKPDCGSVAQGFCGAIDRCASLWLEAAYGDMATCVARLTISCEHSIAVPGTGATEANTRACANGLATVSCADLFENRFGSCDFAGALGNGETCSADAQCQSARCNRNGMCGTCAARALAGESCDDNDQCAGGLVCTEGDNRRCTKPGGPGDACGRNASCGFGLYCSGNVCAKQSRAGEPCAGEDSCDGIAGLYCNDGAGVCQVAGRANPGEQCGLVDDKFVYCVGGSECRGGLGGGLLGGVCATPAKDGENCGSRANGRHCLDPARCTDGVCRLPSAVMCQ